MKSFKVFACLILMVSAVTVAFAQDKPAVTTDATTVAAPMVTAEATTVAAPVVTTLATTDAADIK